MRIKILVLLISFISMAAHAEDIQSGDLQDQPSDVQRAESESEILLPTFEELSQLSPESVEVYIKGMQDLYVELEEIQESEGGMYAFGGTGSLFCAEPSRLPANSVTVNCVYAGFLSHRNASTGMCSRPAQGSCGPSQVQCNPALFGAKVCATTGKRATSSCFERSAARYKNFSDIVKYNQQRSQEWNETLDGLKGYCEGGTQTEVCRLIKKRIDRLNRQVVELNSAAPATQTAKGPKLIQRNPIGLTGSMSELRAKAKARQSAAAALVEKTEKGEKSTGRQESDGWFSAVYHRIASNQPECDVRMLIRSVSNVSYDDLYSIACTKTKTIPPVFARKLQAYEKQVGISFKLNGSDDALRYDNLKTCIEKKRVYTKDATVTFRREMDPKTKKRIIVVNDPAGKLSRTYSSDGKESADLKLFRDLPAKGYELCKAAPESALQSAPSPAANSNSRKAGQ